ncbi:uncharacterized protein LOC128559037 [Mercenaria mercenaria]|uniref:uncharacterized protein LOC128559037 n=1 Tax=Mercenaria mercenaria TaxID=6596 RepID=UPI00234F0493|nr:uncharacterized protein LOC128559037 [Mercenaria mercenaria]
MASGGGAIDQETKEAYYLRLHFLLVQEGTSILKAIFDQCVPPSQLQATLQKYSARKQKAKKGNSIVRTNYDLLYPKQNQPNSNTFDISLFFYLLRNISSLNTASQWWNEKENSNIPDTVVDVEADIVRIKNVRNKMQHKTIASLEQSEFLSMWILLEKVMLRLAAKCNFSLSDQKQKIDGVKTRKHDLVSQEMRSLRAHTKIFLKDYNDSKQYVETSAYGKAKDILKKKRIVVLTGHPGEGKTAMAARLALDMSHINNCVNLSGPSDWRMLSSELDLKLLNTVIIDDIFGDGALDQGLVSDWKRYLMEIERAARNGYLRVIITSRHYIFEESKEEITSLPGMFKNENGSVLLLTSADLSHDERHKILKILATKSGKHLSRDKIRDCIKVSEGRSEGGEDFIFGFPECASMFVRNNEMFDTGAVFFEKPASLFKRYLEELYKGKNEDFMALVTVWAKENKRLSQHELRKVTTVSNHIKRMVSAFGFELNRKFLDMMRLSLISHVGGYLVFIETTEEYTFSHNVI